MKKIAFLLLSAAALSLGCKKSSNNSSTPDTYQNTDPNSTWNYRSTDNTGATPPADYTQTSTNRDTSVNGRSYHVFNLSTGGSNYLNISGTDYYQYASLPGTGSVTQAIERLYLKSNLNTNDTWTQDINATFVYNSIPYSIPVRLTNKVVQKGATRVVNNITYNNVIDISIDVKNTNAFIPINIVTDIHEYYAPKYGLIERQAKATITITGSAPQSIDNSTVLLSSDLK
jgi:hypothetical protein